MRINDFCGDMLATDLIVIDYLILWIFTYTPCCCRTFDFRELLYAMKNNTFVNDQTSNLHIKWKVSLVARSFILLRWSAQKRSCLSAYAGDRVPYYFTYFSDNANMVLVFDIALETWKHIHTVLFLILMHGWYRAKIAAPKDAINRWMILRATFARRWNLFRKIS